MRRIRSIHLEMPTMEGAGVRLKRVFGYHQVPAFDPFLLLDHFGSDDPKDYVKGFPWHPHRGIETVTYMIAGEVEHGDSIGNKGVINSGDVQWMTAGSGIIHQEMPRAFDGDMMGFQLWVNLPRENKMTEPRYMGLTAGDLQTVGFDGGKVTVIAGEYQGVKGPVKDLFVETEYFDVHLKGDFRHETRKRTSFIFVYKGSVKIADEKVNAGMLALLDETGDIEVKGEGRFIFVSGDPLKEPVAWGGPIVMNSDAELDKALGELREGAFIKDR